MDMRSIAALSLLLVTLAIGGCASVPGYSPGAELNPYVCNDNEPNDHLAQLSVCRGGGLAPD